jgi:hypothetical protein
MVDRDEAVCDARMRDSADDRLVERVRHVQHRHGSILADEMRRATDADAPPAAHDGQ